MQELKYCSDRLPAGEIVFQKYCIMDVLGTGTFGVVYKAKRLGTNQRVAVKVSGEKPAEKAMMETEFRLYRMLNLEQRIIPEVYEIGQIHSRPAIVMERLGVSLNALFQYCQFYFPPLTVAQLAVQMIDRLAWFHRITGHVHRDVKPDNFVLGYGSSRNVVHLIDFGLAEPYYNWQTRRHIQPTRKSHSFAGTVRYAARNTHRGLAPSRRDDLESLAYTLVYFMRGSLPWQGLRAVTRQQLHEMIAEKKLTITIQELCDGLPNQFAALFEHCHELGYTIEPDYDGMIARFSQLSRQLGGPTGTLFGWVRCGAITKRPEAMEAGTCEHGSKGR